MSGQRTTTRLSDRSTITATEAQPSKTLEECGILNLYVENEAIREDQRKHKAAGDAATIYPRLKNRKLMAFAMQAAASSVQQISTRAKKRHHAATGKVTGKLSKLTVTRCAYNNDIRRENGNCERGANESSDPENMKVMGKASDWNHEKR